MSFSRYATHKCLSGVWIILCWFCCVNPVIGQDYTITKLKLFPDRDEVMIRDVTRDSAGFIWFLTNGEIYRYDGYRSLDILKTLADQRHTDEMPQRILIDHQSRLWMATNTGLEYLDLKTWKLGEIDPLLLPSVENRSVRFMQQLSDSTLVVAYQNGHILLCKGDEIRVLDDLYEQSVETANTLTPESATFWNGCYWISTSGGTMLSIDPVIDYQTRYYPLDDIKQKIFHLVADGAYMYLNVYEEGLYRLDRSGGVSRYVSPDFSISKNDFHVLKQGNTSHVYAENRSFLLLDSLLRVKQRLAIPSDRGFRISGITIAGDEVLLASDEGIFVAYPRTAGISQLIPVNPATNKSVRGVYVYPDGAVFYGAYGGAGFIDPEGVIHRFDSLRYAYAMLPMDDENLLIGTEGGFLKIFNRKEMAVKAVRYQLSLSAREQYVNNLPHYVISLAERKRDYLLGTLNGLWLLDKETYLLRPFDDDLAAKQTMGLHIRHIRSSDSDDLLLSTNIGLFRWKPGSWTKVYPESGNLGVFRSELAGDTLWLATQGGGVVAINMSGGVLQRVTSREGLSSDLVYSLQYVDGLKVAGTANGLNIINGQKIRRIGTAEGLSQTEFNSGASFSDTERNRVYMGGLTGYTILDMTKDWFDGSRQLESYVAEVHTSARNAGEKRSDYTWPYRAEKTLVLQPGQSLTGLYVGTPGNYRADGKIRYAFQEGDWEPLELGQFISLIEPSPGEYRIGLETRSTGADGRKKEVLVVKRPHYYETWWFKFLIAALTVGTLLLWYRSRIHKIRREQAIRNRIAADLHDEVGSSLTRIYFQANVLSSGKEGEGKEDRRLQLIADTSKKALLTMSDMVWSIDARFDTMKDLVSRMKDYAYRLREELDFRYRFEEVGMVESGKVSQEVRQNLFLVFKEALTNAIKYSDGSEILIKLESGRGICLRVINRYRGESSVVSDRQGGLGLTNMERRAAKVGATLSVKDEKGVFEVAFEVVFS